MGFKKWESSRGRNSGIREFDLVRVTDKNLYIGTETLTRCFGSHDRISLYWDEERKVVGMAANGEGIKLAAMKSKDKETGVMSLRWNRFVAHCKIHFDKPCNRKLEKEGELFPID